MSAFTHFCPELLPVARPECKNNLHQRRRPFSVEDSLGAFGWFNRHVGFGPFGTLAPIPKLDKWQNIS